MRLVWAVDDARLANYLVPRECPRVCWTGGTGSLASSSARVVAVEREWLPRLRDAGLTVHRLDSKSFTLSDATAGYWTSERVARVLSVRRVDDCVAAVEDQGAELRVVDSLWRYVDAVVGADVPFSVIRIRNAAPPPRPRE